MRHERGYNIGIDGFEKGRSTPKSSNGKLNDNFAIKKTTKTSKLANLNNLDENHNKSQHHRSSSDYIEYGIRLFQKHCIQEKIDDDLFDDDLLYERAEKNCTILQLNSLMEKLKKIGGKMEQSIVRIKDGRDRFDRRSRIITPIQTPEGIF